MSTVITTDEISTKEQLLNEFPQVDIVLAEYKPWPRNYNQHPTAQIEALVASLTTFGQPKNIVVWTDYIVDGHGLVEAAQSLGWETLRANQIPAHWDESKVEAFLVAANELAKMADPDKTKLSELLADMNQNGIDLKAVGWDHQRLDELLAEVRASVEPTPSEPVDSDVDVDKADELKAKWGTALGQVWQLGEHRVICGDCGNSSVSSLLMGDGLADLLFTDPPYGVSIGAKNRMLNAFDKHGRNLDNIEGDDLSPEELGPVLSAAFVNIRQHLSDQCSIFITAPQGGELGVMMNLALRDAGLPIKHVLIWKKNAATFSMNRLDYDYQHEPILFTWTKTHKRRQAGPYQTSVWEVDKPRANDLHPTMKPIELPLNAMLNHTDVNDICMDMYLGSGSTLMAAESCQRRCFGFEIQPKYVAVILERWSTATGGVPMLVE